MVLGVPHLPSQHPPDHRRHSDPNTLDRRTVDSRFPSRRVIGAIASLPGSGRAQCYSLRWIFATMNVTRARILDPVLSRTKFGEYLAWSKLLCRSIVMVIGEDPGEQVDDRGIALMAVQTNMAAWPNFGSLDLKIADDQRLGGHFEI